MGMKKFRAAVGYLYVGAILFLNPVPGICGFSDANYRQHSERACEGYEIHLRCPGNDVIDVHRAAYGRQDDMTCIVDAKEMRNTHCLLPGTKDVVTKWCNGNTSCSLFVGSKIFNDPCPGTKKYLNVMYECVPYSK